MADSCFTDYHHRFCISNRGRHSPEKGRPTVRDQFQFAANFQYVEKVGLGPKGEREVVLWSNHGHVGLRSIQRIPVADLASFAIHLSLDEFPQAIRNWYKPLFMVAGHALKQELKRDSTREEQEEHIVQTLLGEEIYAIVASRVPLQAPLAAAAAPAPAAPAVITMAPRYQDFRLAGAGRGSPQQSSREDRQWRDRSSNWAQPRQQSGRSDWSDWRSSNRDRSTTTRWPQSGSDWQQSARGRDSGATRRDAPRSRPRTPSRPPPHGDRDHGEWSWYEHPDPNRSRWSWTEEF